MIRRLSLKTKILSTVLLSSLLLLGTGLGGWWALDRVKSGLDQVTGKALPKLSLLSEMRYLGSECTRLFLRVSTEGLSEAEVQRLAKKFEDHVALYNAAEAKYLAMPFEAGEKELFDDQDQKWDKALSLMHGGVELILTQDPSHKEAIQELNATTVAKAKVANNEAFQKLQDFQFEKSAQWREDAVNAAHTGRDLIVLMAVLGIALSFGIGTSIAISLSRALAAIAGNLQSEAQDLNRASLSLTETAHTLSEGVTEQAASLQEGAASMEEISTMVTTTTGSVEKTSQEAASSRALVLESTRVMDRLVEVMRGIESANERITDELLTSNRDVASIVSLIETVSEKTRVIHEIVFQTKLLSFNASVEAARAGEHGKGFSVVAEEVGKLAQMSGNAAKEITQLLEQSVDQVRTTIDKAQKSVDSMVKEGTSRIREGQSTADLASRSLAGIVENTRLMEEHLKEISLASQEQSRGVHEIKTAISQMDVVTQSNASSASESSLAASQLKSRSDSLSRLVALLYQQVQGGEVRGDQAEVHQLPERPETEEPKMVSHRAA